ncbi:family 43 glycosylhydrolase [Sorangium sp. So ce1151]|uniref:family 43 glycosylhydrolase n=1 Tax=Sorangium sp. So ce1151 TaxID=3133332 RepID=UPI003F602ACC
MDRAPLIMRAPRSPHPECISLSAPRPAITAAACAFAALLVAVGCSDGPSTDAPGASTGSPGNSLRITTAGTALRTSEAGGRVTVSVALDAAPSGPITVPVSSSDATEGSVSPTTVSFTAQDWSVPREITVTGVDDAESDGDQVFRVRLGPSVSVDPASDGLVAESADITNTDDDGPGTAAIVVSDPSGPLAERGAPVTFTVRLASQPSAPVTIALGVSDTTEASLSHADLTFTEASWSTAQTVTLSSVDDWQADGAQPVRVAFGSPASEDPEYAALAAPADLELSNLDDDVGGGYQLRTAHTGDAPLYVAHSYYHAMITNLDDRANNQLPADFQWRVVPALANPDDPTLVSFESVGFAGRYLHVDSASSTRYPPQSEASNRADGLWQTPPDERSHLLWIDVFTDTAEFRRDATFRIVPALNGDPTMVSLQWYSDATRYLRHLNYQIHAHVLDGTAVERSEASFALEPLGYLISQRADPHIKRHTDGYYYFTASVPTYDRIEIRRATTIRGLADATPKVVWTKHATGPMAAHIWAPELHFIDGKWYIYFAAGSSTDIWAIRMYALESSSANPMDGAWAERGQIVTDSDTFALDATTFEHDGKRYLVWAQEDPSVAGDNSSLFIAAMVNPWTLARPNVRIARPEHAWETAGFAVNEGAAVLERNGRVFISYSASATDARYCLGLLTASATDDLLSASSWTKNKNPVFVSANGLYGPGHNSFTTSADGSIDVLVYHARNYEKITGDPLYDPNRHTRVQRLGWNADGTPSFGAPLLNGASTIGD